MDRTVAVTENELVLPDRREERGWRAFLGSWQLGAILVLACALGLIAIFSVANPFASASPSERVSNALGNPATCTELAAAQESVYRCTVQVGKKKSVSRCFVLSGGDVKQYVSSRRGC